MKPLDASSAAPPTGSLSAAGTSALRAIEAARDHLLRSANPEGYWLADMETDIGPVADSILLEWFLRRLRPEKIRKAANYIVQRQLPDGGWSLYYGGPADLDLTVKAYFALKLAGWLAAAPEMQRARDAALALGGAQNTGVYTRFYLALFRQFDWSEVPAVPPEVLFLPRFCYAGMYDVAAWTRSMLVPLSIVWAHRPRRSVDAEAGIDELFANAPKRRRKSPLPRDARWFTARNVFLLLDGALRRLDKLPLKPLRSRALRQAEKWVVERLRKSGGFGRTHPALLNSLIALNCLGYAYDHPILEQALGEFYSTEVEDAGTLRFQPWQTPVSDTALACCALAAAAPAAEPVRIAKTEQWLLDHQALRPGDWRKKNPEPVPGGWYAEFDNEFYPSVDTTAQVLLALKAAAHAESRPPAPALQTGLSWLLSMQSSDGGFAAFDRDNDHTLLRHSPLAAHNAMLDDTCADITGHALEALAGCGHKKGSKASDAAITYLRRTQGPEGCWSGRWGVNAIYGTSCALRGLAAAGEDMRESYVVLAIEWLRAVQNTDGGWGESCGSYEDPDAKGVGPSSPSQTAWALLGLLAFGDFHSTSVRRGIEYLVGQQTAEGTWEQMQYTGTRFPRVSYTRNNLHAHCFPLLCLAEYARGAGLFAADRAATAEA